MTFKGHLAHLINQINNGIKLKKFSVRAKKFTYSFAFLHCLLTSGYILGYRIDLTTVEVHLKYLDDNSPVISRLKLVSGPSGRRFFKKHEIMPNGIYSTDEGFVLGSTLKNGIRGGGGELVAYVCQS